LTGFKHSICEGVPADLEARQDWAHVKSHYLAPECYENVSLPESDVFAFALILYELVAGQPAFPKTLGQPGVAKRLIIDEWRPRIPQFVLPGVRDLISDCWATEPTARPSFNEILERLESLQFQLRPDANSLRLTQFVNRVKASEGIADAQ
jgi:hypothetical protein